MRKKHKALLHITSLTLYFLIFFLLYRQLTEQDSLKKHDNYDCQAVFTLENGDLKMPAVAGVSVKNDKGVILFGGPVYRNHIYIGSISRRVAFDYTEEFSCTVFKQCKTIKFEKDNLDDRVAKQILPGFFTNAGSASYFRIHKLKGGILFKKDNIPMFFCSYN